MKQSGKILILEDDDALRELLAEVLQDEGREVIAVSCGESAIEAAASELLDLVVLDVRMPGLDGLDTLSLMHGQLRGASTLVITGYASEDDSIRALRLGVADYLKKPFELSSFMQKVEELSQRTQRQRLQQGRESRLISLNQWTISSVLASACAQPLSSQERSRVVQGAQLARAMGELLGFEPPELYELSTGCALMGLSSYSDIAPLLQDPSCPSFIRQLFEDATTLAANLAHLATIFPQSSAEYPLIPEAHRELLLQAYHLAQAQLSSHHDAPAHPASLGADMHQQTALLDLGMALLQTGAWAEAYQTFCRACHQTQGTLALEAHLCLAETARLSQRYGEIAEILDTAIKLGGTIGPCHQAQAYLRGALCLIKAALPQARPWLEQSGQIFSQLRLQGEWARATLALATQSDMADEQLLSALAIYAETADLPPIIEDCPWLVPELLHRLPASGSDNQLSEEELSDQEAPLASPFWAHLNRLCHLNPHYFWEASQDPLWERSQRLWALKLLCDNAAFLPSDMRAKVSTQLTAADPGATRICRPSEAAEAIASAAHRAGHAPNPQCRESLLSYAPCQTNPTLQLTTLGGFSVRIGGGAVADKLWHTSKTKYLLVYLLSHPHGIEEDTLIEAFWPRNWETGKQNIYAATSRLRRVLKPFYAPQTEFILRERSLLIWDSRLPCWFDLAELRQAASRTHQADSPNAWRRIADLGRNPFLPGCDMEWAEEIRREVESQRRLSLRQLSHHYWGQQRPAEALEYARQLQELEPYDMDCCELILRAHMRLGQNDRALRHYQRFCLTLQRDLQAQPTTALIELFHKARLGIHA